MDDQAPGVSLRRTAVVALMLTAALFGIFVWAAGDDVVVWLVRGACLECVEEQDADASFNRPLGVSELQQRSGAAVWEHAGGILYLVARQRHGDMDVVCDLASPCWDRCSYVPSAFAADLD